MFSSNPNRGRFPQPDDRRPIQRPPIYQRDIGHHVGPAQYQNPGPDPMLPRLLPGNIPYENTYIAEDLKANWTLLQQIKDNTADIGQRLNTIEGRVTNLENLYQQMLECMQIIQRDVTTIKQGATMRSAPRQGPNQSSFSGWGS